MDMIEELTESMKESVRQALPQAVADELVQVLSKGKLAQEMVTGLTGENKALKELNKELGVRDEKVTKEGTRLADEYRMLASASKNLDARTKDVEVREAVIELRELQAKEKVTMLRAVVTDVFGNSRFKYERTIQGDIVLPGIAPVPDTYGNPVGGCTSLSQLTTTTEKVEGEGDIKP